MKQYLCLAYYDKEKFDTIDAATRRAIIAQCPAMDDTLRATGRVSMMAALGAPRSTRSIRPARSGRGDASVTDGPFTEAKEIIGGLIIIEAEDMDDAVRIASKHPAANIGGEMGWGIEIWPLIQVAAS